MLCACLRRSQLQIHLAARRKFFEADRSRIGSKSLLHLGNGIGSKSSIRKRNNALVDDGRDYNFEFLDKVLDGLDRNSISGDVNFFIHVVKMCGHLKALGHGRRIHEHLTAFAVAENGHLGTHIIQMYLNCGSLAEAFETFYSMPTKDLVLWTTMTTAFAGHGHWQEVLRLFDLMEMNSLRPVKTTYIAVLKAYASPECLPGGRLIHGQLAEIGADSHELVKAALLEMYAKCGSFEEAKNIFRTVHQDNHFAWNAMIAACVQHGQYRLSLELFEVMKRSYLRLGKTTYAAAIDACTQALDLEAGKQIHQAVVEEGYESDLLVAKALLGLYGKCGTLEEARRIFDGMVHKDARIWSLMISIFADHGRCKEGFGLLRQMQAKGLVVDAGSCIELLACVTRLLALEQGKALHNWILEMGVQSDVSVASALVEMYSKCGNLPEAEALFERMELRTVASWNSMLLGYVQGGFSLQATQMFAEMQLDGSNWDRCTFASLILACGNSGLTKQGIQHFVDMTRDFRLLSTAEHHACVVSVLGRRGWLQDIDEFIDKLPAFHPAVWDAYLIACRANGDHHRAAVAAAQVLECRPEVASPYLILAGIYREAGNLEVSLQFVETMIARKVVQERARSSILIEGTTYHEFETGDRSHGLIDRIHEELESFKVDKEANKRPLQLHDVADELLQRQEHSEKLALGLGLLKTAAGTVLRIVKNCRMCGNCHDEFKMVSKLTGRNIIVRAGQTVHSFSSGLCSCKDYW